MQITYGIKKELTKTLTSDDELPFLTAKFSARRHLVFMLVPKAPDESRISPVTGVQLDPKGVLESWNSFGAMTRRIIWCWLPASLALVKVHDMFCYSTVISHTDTPCIGYTFDLDHK